MSKENLALLRNFDWRIPIYYFNKDSNKRQVPGTYCWDFKRVYVYLFLQVYTRESLAINVKVKPAGGRTKTWLIPSFNKRSTYSCYPYPSTCALLYIISPAFTSIENTPPPLNYVHTATAQILSRSTLSIYLDMWRGLNLDLTSFNKQWHAFYGLGSIVEQNTKPAPEL